MKKTRLIWRLLIIALVIHLFAATAAAHPLGNFTTNQYAGLQIWPHEIQLEYILDLAEIPAFQAIAALDTNQNSRPDRAEAAHYQAAQCETVKAGLVLSLNGRPAPLQLRTSAVKFPPGAGGLSTLRLTCLFQTSLEQVGEATAILFQNKVYPDRLGWREIVVVGEGISLPNDLAGLSHSPSQRLTAYPDGLLASPLDQRQVSFVLQPFDISTKQTNLLAPSTKNVASTTLPTPRLEHSDRFTQLITQPGLSLPTLLLALLIAFVWGAGHALTPGHGKTIVAAYLVGSRGTARHALFLGLTTTITHTLGVFALGGITLFVSAFILPEQLYPWLSVGSGLLVVGIGLSLLKARLRRPAGLSHHHHHHHHHDHGQDHHHHHHHLPLDDEGTPVTWRQLLALGASGGLLPCPSALIVMLSAVALQRVGFGLLLILVFSLGLASVLTAIGLLFVHAGRFFDYLDRLPRLSHFSWRTHLVSTLPLLSALFITLIGLGIIWQGLGEMGTMGDW